MMSTNTEQRLQQQIFELMLRVTAEREARQKAELETSSWRNHYDAVSIAANNYRSRAEAAEKLYADEQDMRIAEEKLRRAAEARIKASQEQEPCAWIVLVSGEYSHIRDTDPAEREDPEEDRQSEISYVNLYQSPPIPPEVAELQRENAELTTLIEEAKRQAVPEGMIALPATCQECGTKDIEYARMCHNSKCKGYAMEFSVYEGWRAAPQPERKD